MSEALSIVSITAILELPWYVGIPGLLAIALLLWSAFWSIVALRPVQAIIRIVFALAIAVILSQGGEALSQLIGGGPPA